MGAHANTTLSPHTYVLFVGLCSTRVRIRARTPPPPPPPLIRWPKHIGLCVLAVRTRLKSDHHGSRGSVRCGGSSTLSVRPWRQRCGRGLSGGNDKSSSNFIYAARTRFGRAHTQADTHTMNSRHTSIWPVSD